MPSITPERRECLAVLLRWRADGREHLDQIVGELSEPSGRRGFVQNLCYGVVRNLRVLDLWIGHLSEGGRSPDPRTRAVLRMGLYELFFGDTADHAAVNEAVSLAGRSRSFVNALLRRAGRERDELEGLAADAPVAVRYSHPDFLVDRWERELGHERTVALCAWDQEPAPLYVRMNRLRGSGRGSGSGGERERLAQMGRSLEGEDGFWAMERLPWEALESGLVYAQDPSTVAACLLLAPEPGQRVLDACASPGGKTAFLAQMMENRGEIIATDPKPSRMERLAENLGRLGVEIAEIHPVEWGVGNGEIDVAEEGFDRILVDAPCSNTGVLRRRVDARWRIAEGEFARLAQLQLDILEDVARYLRPGGRLVYSTCSIDAEENRGVVEAFLAGSEGWVLEEERFSIPPGSGFDGAYAAALKRSA